MSDLSQRDDGDSGTTESVNLHLDSEEETQSTNSSKAFSSATDLALWVLRMMMKSLIAIVNSICRPSLGVTSTQGISSLMSDGGSGSRTERTLQMPKNDLAAPNTRPSNLQAKKWDSNSSIGFPSSQLQLICDRLLTIDDPFHEARLGERSETLREVSQLMSDTCLSELNCAELLRTATSTASKTFMRTLNFELAVFVLPKGSSLPLHDHPDMAVLSNIVLGRVKVWSLDMLGEKPNKRGWRRARLIKSEVADDSYPTMILTPTSGNLHKLVAETPCVMLDVLLPPYCEEGSRLCTFYKPRIDLNEVKIGEELMLEKILSTA